MDATVVHTASGESYSQSLAPKSRRPRIPDPGRAAQLRRAAELELMHDLIRELQQGDTYDSRPSAYRPEPL